MIHHSCFFALTEHSLMTTKKLSFIFLDTQSITRIVLVNGKKGVRNVGGVALYIRDDHAITCEVVFRYSDNVIQALGVHIKTLNLLIYVIYRQPDDTIRNNRSTSVQFSKLLKNLKEQFKSHNSPEPDVILLGNLNLPRADWLNG